MQLAAGDEMVDGARGRQWLLLLGHSIALRCAPREGCADHVPASSCPAPAAGAGYLFRRQHHRAGRVAVIESDLIASRLLKPPPDQDFWVFAYGSLMWRPGFAFLERQPALLRGYHRAFCVYSHHYRGTAARPGLVLGLDRGGSCRGRAYRVAAA